MGLPGVISLLRCRKQQQQHLNSSNLQIAFYPYEIGVSGIFRQKELPTARLFFLQFLMSVSVRLSTYAVRLLCSRLLRRGRGRSSYGRHSSDRRRECFLRS